jgi:hypothetical protein
MKHLLFSATVHQAAYRAVDARFKAILSGITIQVRQLGGIYRTLRNQSCIQRLPRN